MMTHDTNFASGRTINPAGLAGAAAINGGILALLLTLATGVARDAPNIIDLINPTIAPPPAVTRDKPKPVEKDMPRVGEATRDTPQPKGNSSPAQSNNTVLASAGDITFPPLPPFGPAADPIEPTIPDPIVPIIRTPAKVDARYASQFQPSYPTDMQRGEMEGRVTVRVLVGIDGRVKAIEAVHADHDSFLAATRSHALKKWRFKPATENGEAVESWREMTVRFEMTGLN